MGAISQNNNAAENKYLYESLCYTIFVLVWFIMYSIIAPYSTEHIKQFNWSA